MRTRPPVRLKREVLWKRLEALNRSQTWLAREAGITPGYLSALVNEGRAPSGSVRRRLQEVLGMCGFDELFELEDRDEND